jgi:release factor glutamine methyltransferase
MTDNQAFAFLSKIAPARDVKVILKNKRINWLNIWRIAWQLRRSVPVAKIIRKKWFYGLPFYTDKWTLDPRPDSETLVDAVLSCPLAGRDRVGLRAQRVSNSWVGVKILDLGTGTGCLLCAIVKNMPNATGVGIEKSWRACRIARKNVKNLGLENKIEIIRGKFKSYHLSPITCHLIIANPPYVPDGDKNVNRGARHDPKMALYGGKDGLKFYRQIAKYSPSSQTKLFLEIGAGQENAVKRIFRDTGWQFLEKHKDLSGRVRVLVFRK